MKKMILPSLLIIVAAVNDVFSQNSIALTFTGIHDTSYFQPGSIKIKNLSQGGDTILYYPDTVLILSYVGIDENHEINAGFTLSQNYPNPVAESASIDIYIPSSDKVIISIADIKGRNLLNIDKKLEEGLHSFRFTPGGECVYFFSVKWHGNIRTIKIINNCLKPGTSCSLDYTGIISKTTGQLKSAHSIQDFPFIMGDKLMFIGYADTLESGIVDIPETSQEYVFQFAANIPCPGLDSLFYDGHWYHTIQVFSQCWLKENMNAGMMIPSSQDQTNNDLIEKYCMGDNQYNCNLLGGLYFWNEMMKYNNTSGGQGICPDGFHVPTDLEWQILEGAADSTYEIGGPEWNVNGWRGNNAGGNLKQTGTDLWEYPNTGATNAYGLTIIPAGYFVQGGFWGPGYKTYIWSSNYVGKYYRNMDWNQAKIQRNTGGPETAFSVRCIKN
jgi:uncharacterized protein (TIGR02145 family)